MTDSVKLLEPMRTGVVSCARANGLDRNRKVQPKTAFRQDRRLTVGGFMQVMFGSRLVVTIGSWEVVL